jgi:small-conductance mechanosensitive channel
MKCIYTYTPETNHVPKEYNVAAILSLLSMVPTSLALALALMYFYISTFRSMCIIIIIIIIIIMPTSNE